jgi:hypothetical protein
MYDVLCELDEYKEGMVRAVVCAGCVDDVMFLDLYADTQNSNDMSIVRRYYISLSSVIRA